MAPSVGRRTSCCIATQVRPSGTETERRRDYLREGFGAQHQAPTETSQNTQNRVSFFVPPSAGVRTSCCVATQVRRRRTDSKRRSELNAAVLVRSSKPLLVEEMFLSFCYVVAPSVGRRTSCCL